MEDPYLLYMLILAAALVLLVAWLAARARRRSPSGPLYRRRDALMSDAEWSFFQVLRRATDERLLVMAKVRIADVITPSPQRDRRLWWRLFNRISAKHFDYLICSADDGRPLLAVELDDRSHDKAPRRRRDALVDEITGQAGLPLVRFPARTGYALQQVRERLGEHLPRAPAPRPAKARTDSAPLCPRCGDDMARREVRGPEGLRPFWVCGRYPSCRGARPAD